MKLLCLVGLLAFLALENTSQAFSIPPQELLPKKLSHGLAFEMSSEELPTGETRFTARLRFPFSFSVEDYVFTVSDITVEETEQSAHWNVSHVRKLSAQQDGDVVTCIFTVTKKELEDPLLSFSFYQVPRKIEPVAPFTRFARLSKYLTSAK
jgi:hypothetical protein